MPASVWEWLNTNGSGLSAVATIVTALVALWAIRAASVDSRERSRPMMLAEFRPALHSDSTIDIVIRNAGPSVARDVSVTFDPVPVVPKDPSGLVTPYLLQRYQSPIPTVAPGQELSNIWFSGRPIPGSNEMSNHEPTSDAVSVSISYRGPRGNRYQEVFPLHLDTIRMMTYSTSSESMPGWMKSISQSIKSIEESTRAIVKAANYIRRDEIRSERSRHEQRLAAFIRGAESHEAGGKGSEAPRALTRISRTARHWMSRRSTNASD